MRKDWTTLIRQDLEDLTSAFSTGRPGAASLLPGDRRSVAVLYLDLAGFTAMSEVLDHETVHEICTGIMTVLSRIVTFHGGYVDKFEGDRIMALFGAERVHENDCIRAVACSLRMMEAVRDLAGVLHQEGLSLSARAGISFGDVTVAPDPSGHLTAIGDHVNTASRMEETAEVGTVQVTGAVRQECGDQFSWEDLGFETADGRSRPVHAWRPLGPGKTQVERWERASRLAAIPFVGRKDELALLENLLRLQDDSDSRNRRGGATHIVAGVCGDAGVGKSRLLHEFCSRIEKRSGDVLILRTGCISYAQPPMWPLIQILRELPGEGGDQLAQLDSLRPESLKSLGELLSSEMSPCDTGIPGGGDSGSLGYFPAVADLFRMLSERHGRLIVVIDDVQWIDSATSEAFEFLVSNCDTARPVLFLLLFRPEPPAGPGLMESLPEGYSETRRIDLGEIDDHGAREIAARLLGIGRGGASGSDAAIEFLLGTSGGNIFFMEELVLGLTETGVLEQREDGSWALQSDPEGQPLPSTVAGLVRSRIDHLPEDQRRILQLSSVLGNTFETEVLVRAISAAWPRTGEPGVLLEELCRRGFLFGSAGESDAGFRHSLIRDSVYSSILRHNRRILHSICASVLVDTAGDRPEAISSIACHWEDAGDRANALAWGEKALDLAWRRCDWRGILDWTGRLEKWLPEPLRNAEDARLLFRILEKKQNAQGSLLDRKQRFWTLERLDGILRGWELQDERPTLLLQWGKYYRSTENITEALKVINLARELFEGQGDSVGSALSMSGIALCHESMGDLREARDWHRKAVALLREAERDDLLADALKHLASVTWRQGMLDEALPMLEEAQELVRRTGNRSAESAILSTKGLVLKGMGRNEEALALTAESLEITRETGNRSRELSNLNMMGNLLRISGRIDEARDYGIRALEASREAGETRMEGNVLNSLGILERIEKRFERALDYYRQSLDRHRIVGNRVSEAIVLGNIGNVLCDMNRMHEALESYRESAALHRETGNLRILAEVLSLIAVVSLDLEDEPEGIDLVLSEAREAAGETGNRMPLVLADLATAILAERRGETEEAMRLYREVYAGTNEMGMSRESSAVLAGMARIEIARDNLEDARRHLLGALSISAQGAGSIHIECDVHLSMAQVCLAAGERRKAKRYAATAMEFAAAIGDPRFLGRAEEMVAKCSES
jgi:class 3 adenylate cyclase/tetratricopeptide (TPR) repeat protein